MACVFLHLFAISSSMAKHRRTEVKTEVSKKSPNDRPVECSRDDQMMDQELRCADAMSISSKYHLHKYAKNELNCSRDDR